MASSILPENTAVLYLRVSSKKQDKSISAQRQELVAYATRQGYEVRREYVDEGVSGDQTEKRSAFLRLREDAEQERDFAIILVWDEDRLSRSDPLEVGYWLKPIRDAGIVVETPRGRVDWESLSGRLIYLIQQEMKHNYLRDLSRNVSRGLLASAREGRGGTGGRSPQGLRNDPDRAAIVRRIFADYLKPGASLRSVAEGLNRGDIPTPRGKKWSVTTVRYVLRNQKYVGDFVRFKYRAGRYHVIQGGEIVSRAKADPFEEVAPTIIRDHHEGIIDRQTFEKAQAKLARQKKDTAPRTGRRYAFSGLLRCGDCGLVMGGAPRRKGNAVRSVYVCHTYIDGGKSACFRNEIREEALLGTIVRLIQDRYLSEKAIERLREAAHKHQQRARREMAPPNNAQVQRRIRELDRQIDQGVERVFSAPDRLVNSIYTKLGRLREERDRLQAALDSSRDSEKDSGDQDTQIVEKAIEALRNLQEAFHEAEPEALRDLIRSLVSKVELHFDHEQNGSRTRNVFSRGTIFVKPEPAVSSVLFTKAGS